MLSSRAKEWARCDYAHGPKHLYDPETNPTGVVSFGNAENLLVTDEVTEYINKNCRFDEACCTYNEGMSGTLRLSTAMAAHMTEHFATYESVDAEDLTFLCGVTSLNEVVTLITCDPDSNDSLLLGAPIYGSFNIDLVRRTGVRPFYAVFDPDKIDQFGPDCIAGFEEALQDAQDWGVEIKGLLICNPHNPLGRCYSRKGLTEIVRLCSRHNIHLISDEIYALSVYGRDDGPSESFTSVLSLDLASLIDPRLVHVLYGFKDYGAVGLRLGCLHSKNKEFTDAARAIGRFTSPSQYSMSIAADMLTDRVFMTDFLKLCRKRLRDARKYTEELLDKNKIKYDREGNAGFFMWLDLSPYLNISAKDDIWNAHDRLCEQLKKAGVQMAESRGYHGPEPGRFRLIFSLQRSTIDEGMKRIRGVLDMIERSYNILLRQ